MKSIKEVENYIDELIMKADGRLPADSIHYYEAGLYAVLDFLKEETKE